MRHAYLIVAISRHRLWLISKTTNLPTTSEFLQLLRTSAKFFQSAFFAILYQALRDALHSLCRAVAARMAFRLTIRIRNLRNMRSWRQPEKSPNSSRIPTVGTIRASLFGRGPPQFKKFAQMIHTKQFTSLLLTYVQICGTLTRVTSTKSLRLHPLFDP